MTNVLISGDPLNPQGSDLISQTASLRVGLPVPQGWNVLSGNHLQSEIITVTYRDNTGEHAALEAAQSRLLEAMQEVRSEITRINEAAGRTVFNPSATSALQEQINIMME